MMPSGLSDFERLIISASAYITEIVDGQGIRPDTDIRCFRRRALFHSDVTVMTVRGAKSKDSDLCVRKACKQTVNTQVNTFYSMA
jgi:hypothetical protein